MKKFVLVWIFISLTVGFNPRLSRLGVDYGPRKIGIASSNMFGFIQPVRTIKNTGNLTGLLEYMYLLFSPSHVV